MSRKHSVSAETLRLLSFCPLCERRNTGMDAQMVGSSGETQLMYVQCRVCHHSLLTLVLQNGELVSSVGLVTDLSLEDLFRIPKQKSVSIDDVLLAHRSFGNKEYIRKMIKRA